MSTPLPGAGVTPMTSVVGSWMPPAGASCACPSEDSARIEHDPSALPRKIRPTRLLENFPIVRPPRQFPKMGGLDKGQVSLQFGTLFLLIFAEPECGYVN